MSARRPLARRVALVAAGTAGGLSAASAAGSLGAASYFARVLLTPERDRPDNVTILAITDDTITFDVTEDSVCPGWYGLWFDQGAGHLRVGDILELDETAGRVTRELQGVDLRTPTPGPARWDGYYYGDRPDVSLGLPTTDVVLPGEVGDLPAWLVPGGGPNDDCDGDGDGHDDGGGDGDGRAVGGAGGRWAVLVHGRGATRHECLRAVPTLHALGITALVPTYRNDPQGPPSPDGKYNLGLSEWRDIEAAIRYALQQGARDVVLLGWSMGGAIVLQTLDRSELSRYVRAVVLDAPVIDWGDVIAHQARLRRLPRWLALLAQTMLGARWSQRLVGLTEVLDVARTNWQHRADEIRHDILLIHSRDDTFVPVGPSRELARRRPDRVRFEEWSVARHVREWNVDRDRWERVVADYLRGL